MSLPRREAREHGANDEACQQRMVKISRLPDFFLLLISRVERSRALVSCGLGLGAGDEHASFHFGLDDRGPGAGFDFGCKSLALDGVAALADTNLPLPIAAFSNRCYGVPRNCCTRQNRFQVEQIWSKKSTAGLGFGRSGYVTHGIIRGFGRGERI